jgi:hypothetical protein
MAFVSVSTSKFFLADSASTSQDISAYIKTVEGLPGKRDLFDLSVFGSVGHQWGPSLQNAEFSVNALYSEDATTGAAAMFNTMRTATVTKAFTFYPNGTTGKAIAGSCWMDDYSIRAQVGEYVLANIHMKADNGVTAAS